MKEQNTKLLEVRGLGKQFRGRGGATVRALSGVSFELPSGVVVGLVGESGSGKSTLGRTILRLVEPDEGQVLFDGADITAFSNRRMRPLRRRMQMVFQDPFSSLDPRMTVGQTVAEALAIHHLVPRRERRARVGELLTSVGLLPEYAERYPHEFSGGQRQRVGIARALAVEPEFLIADEPVSALDLSIQAQIVGLLQDLHRKLSLTMLFISHDLTVVRQLCQRVIVLYRGRIMEVASTAELYSGPKHPYTEALLSAVPVPVPGARRHRILLRGETESGSEEPSGCVFRARCPYATAECSAVVPELREIGPGHFKACIRDVL